MRALRSILGACALAGAFSLLVPAGASAALPSVVPPRLLKTIRDARQVWILHIGAVDMARPGELPSSRGLFAGRQVIDRYELPPAAAQEFAGVLGSERSYTDAASAKPPAAGHRGARVGFAFESPGEFAHVYLDPSGGTVRLEYFNGLLMDAALTPQAQARWETALRHYLRAHGVARADFDRAFSSAEAPPAR